LKVAPGNSPPRGTHLPGDLHLPRDPTTLSDDVVIGIGMPPVASPVPDGVNIFIFSFCYTREVE